MRQPQKRRPPRRPEAKTLAANRALGEVAEMEAVAVEQPPVVGDQVEVRADAPSGAPTHQGRQSHPHRRPQLARTARRTGLPPRRHQHPCGQLCASFLIGRGPLRRHDACPIRANRPPQTSRGENVESSRGEVASGGQRLQRDASRSSLVSCAAPHARRDATMR